jgi:cold shock CspA family protein
MAYKPRTFHGTVVRFWRARGYGRIKIDIAPREAHFHLRDCEGIGGDQIKEGVRLEFNLIDDPKGLTAIRVSLLKSEVRIELTSGRRQSRKGSRQW